LSTKDTKAEVSSFWCISWTKISLTTATLISLSLSEPQDGGEWHLFKEHGIAAGPRFPVLKVFMALAFFRML
jgi:hypothetical protein